MSADTAAKRYSAMNIASPWRGLNVVPDVAIPDGERFAAMFLYSGIAAAPPATLAAITGTATSGITEADVVAGGKTLIITLTNDTWAAAGAAFDAQRQAIINGLDSAQSELTGWNAEVRDAEAVTAVVRTSDTVVTITLSAAPAYDITATETITVTVPSSALTTSLVDVTGTPTFTVSPVAAPDTGASGGWEYARMGRRRCEEELRQARIRFGVITPLPEACEPVRDAVAAQANAIAAQDATAKLSAARSHLEAEERYQRVYQAVYEDLRREDAAELFRAELALEQESRKARKRRAAALLLLNS